MIRKVFAITFEDKHGTYETLFIGAEEGEVIEMLKQAASMTGQEGSNRRAELRLMFSLDHLDAEADNRKELRVYIDNETVYPFQMEIMGHILMEY